MMHHGDWIIKKPFSNDVASKSSPIDKNSFDMKTTMKDEMIEVI